MGIFKRRTKPVASSDMVDFDQDLIPIGDSDNPTSLLMTLTMRAGAVSCHLDESSTPPQWVVTVDDKTYKDPSQKKALQQALEQHS